MRELCNGCIHRKPIYIQSSETYCAYLEDTGNVRECEPQCCDKKEGLNNSAKSNKKSRAKYYEGVSISELDKDITRLHRYNDEHGTNVTYGMWRAMNESSKRC